MNQEQLRALVAGRPCANRVMRMSREIVGSPDALLHPATRRPETRGAQLHVQAVLRAFKADRLRFILSLFKGRLVHHQKAA
jgi:hypothetical protein